jgi:hypothetical protein
MHRVPRSRRDEDRIACADRSTFAVEFYLARAFEVERLKLTHVLPPISTFRFCPSMSLAPRGSLVSRQLPLRSAATL